MLNNSTIGLAHVKFPLEVVAPFTTLGFSMKKCNWYILLGEEFFFKSHNNTIRLTSDTGLSELVYASSVSLAYSAMIIEVLQHPRFF